MRRQATAYERAKWLRRAETIQRKARELLDDMIEAVGVEHGVTDSADGVVEQAENLTHVLSTSTLKIWDQTP